MKAEYVEPFLVLSIGLCWGWPLWAGQSYEVMRGDPAMTVQLLHFWAASLSGPSVP